ncbi:1-acyl-sn-glycerol-3-phosphate acyltransferase [Rhodococcus sp. X156]|uniref:1-acyl-sn-glycerol-3-phosphate acyltransferase n=1 Tax=Rhodococcus sp. X156 TaxID=2499145 RepID=UPI000FDAEA16|nr:1-acyl-sn-glycerol-3-phosphate acyltransferase [Rhodococcus sp. X156]
MTSPPALLRRLGTEVARRYHRLELAVAGDLPDRPVLLVANHGFGALLDVTLLAVAAALHELRPERPVTVLAHPLAWTLGFGALAEAFGARPASMANALEAFAQDHHVLVLPGGDVEAAATWNNRNRIIFDGRPGFAALALRAEVPIVPVVTAGVGETLLVLADGQNLARAARLDTWLNLRALPLSVSLPWGLNLGLVGLVLPYLPLPSKLCTAVLPAVQARDGESAEDLAGRVQTLMQDRLTAMTEGRRPVLG